MLGQQLEKHQEQGGIELSAIRVRTGGTAFSKTKMLAAATVPFLSPPLEEPICGHYICIHQPSSNFSPLPGDSFRPHPTQCASQTKLFFQWLFHTNAPFQLMLQTFLKSLKQEASGLSMYLSLSGPRPDTRVAVFDSQLGLSWAPLSPAQIAAICRSLCSSCRVAPHRT